MLTPRECFLSVGQCYDDHHYRRIFIFVDFGEHANNFLKACGAKTKPGCSDIVNILLKNPSDFLENIYAEGERDHKKYVKDPLHSDTCADCQYRYLDELRLIAIGYDSLSKEQKDKMKEAKIFVGRRSVSGSPDADQFKFPLTPSDILIADGLENHRIFNQDTWLAPQEEIFESP